MIDDRHRRHELRDSRRLRVVSSHTTVPAALDVVRTSIPAWQRPSPRPGRQLAIAYRRKHPVLRAVCRVLPFLIPAARWLA